MVINNPYNSDSDADGVDDQTEVGDDLLNPQNTDGDEFIDALDGEASPLNPDQPPKALSPTDPGAAWTTRGRHKVMFGYSLNYLIDMEAPVILDVEATPTRLSKEVEAGKTMVERTAECFDLKPDHLAGDVAYGVEPVDPGAAVFVGHHMGAVDLHADSGVVFLGELREDKLSDHAGLPGSEDSHHADLLLDHGRRL